MYRGCFGNPDTFREEAYGLVLDRALQLELDRLSQPAMDGALSQVAEATAGVEVGFIPAHTLAEWRQFVLELVGRGFSWERLRFMARRIAGGDDSHPAHRVADESIRGMPGSLDGLFQYVSREDLERFRERAVDSLVVAVEDYLS